MVGNAVIQQVVGDQSPSGSSPVIVTSIGFTSYAHSSHLLHLMAIALRQVSGRAKEFIPFSIYDSYDGRDARFSIFDAESIFIVKVVMDANARRPCRSHGRTAIEPRVFVCKSSEESSLAVACGDESFQDIRLRRP